jgi:hypothetical protein
MSTEYSKAALKTFLDTGASQGLFNSNTVAGYKAATARILEQVDDAADVRSIDIGTEIRRYNNSHPGELSPASLGQYARRLEVVIEEFVKYVNDPANYKGRGRSPTEGNGGSKKTESKVKRVPLTGKSSSEFSVAPAPASAGPMPTAGLSYQYPLRPEFLAQVVVPRDMKADEARRLARFLMSLTPDYDPTKEQI